MVRCFFWVVLSGFLASPSAYADPVSQGLFAGQERRQERMLAASENENFHTITDRFFFECEPNTQIIKTSIEPWMNQEFLLNGNRYFDFFKNDVSVYYDLNLQAFVFDFFVQDRHVARRNMIALLNDTESSIRVGNCLYHIEMDSLRFPRFEYEIRVTRR